MTTAFNEFLLNYINFEVRVARSEIESTRHTRRLLPFQAYANDSGEVIATNTVRPLQYKRISHIVEGRNAALLPRI
jgi:hypothetical protein